MKKSLSSLICMVMGIICCISMLAVGIAAAVSFQSQFNIYLSFSNTSLLCKISLYIPNTGTYQQIIFDNTPGATTIDEDYATFNPLNSKITLGTYFGTPTSDNNFVFTFENYNSLDIMATCDVSGTITGSLTNNLLSYTVTNSVSPAYTSTNAPNSTRIIQAITTNSPPAQNDYDSATLIVNAQAHTAGNLNFNISLDAPFELEQTLTNLTTSNNNSGVVDSYDFKTTLTPETNYALPDTRPTITCSGNPLQTAIIASNVYAEGTNEYYYNSTTGELIIFKEAITGPIEITASGVALNP